MRYFSISSAVFGRLSLIPGESNVPKPLAIDDKYLESQGNHTGSQPYGIPSALSCFVCCTELFQALRDAVELCANTADPSKYSSESALVFSRLTQMLDLNNRLNDFEKSLPPYLKSDEISRLRIKGVDKRQLRLQAEIIDGFILGVRLVALRPALVDSARRATARPAGSTSKSLEMLRNELSQTCIDNAAKSIELFHVSMKRGPHLLGSLAVIIIFAATTVIISAPLCPHLELGGGRNKDYRQNLISMGLEILEEQRWCAPAAQIALERLKSFQDIVDGAIKPSKEGKLW
jgi:hypothetical protein